MPYDLPTVPTYLPSGTWFFSREATNPTMETSIRYVARTPILQREKAFSTDFPIDHVVGVENIRARNVEPEDHAVTVEAVEDPSQWKLDVHGFCFLKSETHIDPDKLYKNKKDVQAAYWYEIEAILHEHFPQYSRFEAFDLKVGNPFDKYGLAALSLMMPTVPTASKTGLRVSPNKQKLPPRVREPSKERARGLLPTRGLYDLGTHLPWTNGVLEGQGVRHHQVR